MDRDFRVRLYCYSNAEKPNQKRICDWSLSFKLQINIKRVLAQSTFISVFGVTGTPFLLCQSSSF